MSRRAEASPTLRKVTPLLVFILATGVWIAIPNSPKPSSDFAATTPGASSQATTTVAHVPTTPELSIPRKSEVSRAAAQSAPKATSRGNQGQSLALEELDLPLTLPTFDDQNVIPAMSGIRAVLDPVTGKLRVPSEEERRRMAELTQGLPPLFDDQPLVSQTFPNGGEIVTLDDRYMEFVVVERGPDGKLRTRHVSGSQPPVAGTAGATPRDR